MITTIFTTAMQLERDIMYIKEVAEWKINYLHEWSVTRSRHKMTYVNKVDVWGFEKT